MQPRRDERSLLNQLKTEIEILKEDLDMRTLTEYEVSFIKNEIYHLEDQYDDLSRLIRQIH